MQGKSSNIDLYLCLVPEGPFIYRYGAKTWPGDYLTLPNILDGAKLTNKYYKALSQFAEGRDKENHYIHEFVKKINSCESSIIL